MRHAIGTMLFLLLVLTSPLCLAKTTAAPDIESQAAHAASITGAFTAGFRGSDHGQAAQAATDSPTPRLVINGGRAVSGRLDGWFHGAAQSGTSHGSKRQAENDQDEICVLF